MCGSSNPRVIKQMLGVIIRSKTDMAVPWSPHCGICITLQADPGFVQQVVLVRPDVPKAVQ